MYKLSHQNCKGYGECVDRLLSNQSSTFCFNIKRNSSSDRDSEDYSSKNFFKFLLNLNIHSFLLSALDCAYWDLFGKLGK
jgi:L-alanine-DL-glutamate epimerase-like enolase superfamily enzyme